MSVSCVDDNLNSFHQISIICRLGPDLKWVYNISIMHFFKMCIFSFPEVDWIFPFEPSDLNLVLYIISVYPSVHPFCYSSAADIVSGAYPMPSRLSSVRQLFFKSNRLRHFSSNLSYIWIEYAQQYCPKTCWIRILILITKNRDFWPLTRKVFNVRPWNLI